MLNKSYFNCNHDERKAAIEIMQAGIEWIKNLDNIGTDAEIIDDNRIETNNFDVIGLILRSIYAR